VKRTFFTDSYESAADMIRPASRFDR